MPFAPIVVNSKTFNQAGDGRYMLSTVLFGSAADYFQIRGATANKDRRNVTAVSTRTLEKDVTVNGVTERRALTVQTIITSPTVGFTATEIAALSADNNSFLAANAQRLMAGES